MAPPVMPMNLDRDGPPAHEGWDDYDLYQGPEPRLGWLLNARPTTFQRGDRELSGLELFLLSRDARDNFRVTVGYAPYFYVAVALRYARIGDQVRTQLARRFEAENAKIEAVELEDLDAPNHVAGFRRTYLRLSFDNVRELMAVKRELAPQIYANKKRMAELDRTSGDGDVARPPDELLEALDEIREYDVPYAMRCAIDLNIRVGAWHTVTPDAEAAGDDEAAADGAAVEGGYKAVWQQDVIEKPRPRILAFDIECTKAALKFPNAEQDEVFMISYMVDGQGYLIISRDIVSEDIPDFEYTPKPAFPGPFKVFNEKDEEALLKKFVEHCKELRPHVFVTYNGDFFDWPFMDKRCAKRGISIAAELGIHGNEQGEWRGTSGTVHLDAFAWVKRDSYLPQGSQGLKAVTKYKLGYDPVEVDPEDMVRFARTEPRTMASYSVSDAVATFYLYEVYVNLFIFSLCTVIPNGSEDVLRKGSGTLCEALLMVEAYRAGVVCPNKQVEPAVLRKEGRLVETETYVGGHVESLESGVFRSDIATSFKLDPAAFDRLIANVDRDLEFHARTEADGASREDVANFDQVADELRAALAALRDEPTRTERPRIYHLDVSAMYPNIILTNRLQPTAIVDRSNCAACDYNRDQNKCKRAMDWVWRGEINPASAAETNQLHRQLQYETVDCGDGAGPVRYAALPRQEQAKALKARLRDYSQKVYQKQKVVSEEPRTDVVCMRENSFYIDTVRAFRDRRYEYKGLTKAWKKKRVRAEDAGDRDAQRNAEDKELLFDSLQLAHKCILNSFYGYVMRKGARWRSMPMAGIVTLTGAQLITQARELVEKVGRPLELDTDGIWCMLPASFPENYTLEIKNADGSTKKLPFSYPCGMLNADVHQNYTNHQMQTKNADGGYDVSSECSIFFEVDGPYRCMVLPASTEEGKLLKKRYAVFNEDGSLAELKGFELKRRGELELIKAFQAELFDQFLRGDSLETCYAAVAECANAWLDILEHKGEGMDDDEILELIAENKSLSREISDYEGRKMTSLTTARRIGDFLGDDMIQGSGLQCKLVISAKPAGAPVTERAVPTVIFAAEPAVRRHFLRKWLRDPAAEDPGISDVLDWKYYRDRLEGVVRKIITIPAALQGVANPVPRVPHPEWLRKFVAARDDTRKQTTMTSFFGKENSSKKAKLVDVEDAGGAQATTPVVARARARPRAVDTRRKVPVAETPVPSAEAPQLGTRLVGIERPDFDVWLADRKARWRARRERRKSAKAGEKPRRAAVAQAPARGLKRQTVTDLVKSSTRSLTRGTWRVVEVRETETAGRLTAFVVTDDGLLQRATVHVDKTFYVDAPGADDELEKQLEALGARKVPRCTPPGGDRTPGAPLWEVRVDETRLVEHEATLAAFLAHPAVDACYELRTPARFRATLAAGGACRARRSAAQRLEGAKGALVFAPDDLELAKVDASDAIALLPRAGDAARHLVRVAYLYHGRCARTGRGIVALAFLDRRARGEDETDSIAPGLTLVIADPKARKGDRPPALRRLYDQATADAERDWGALAIDRSETAKTESEALAAAGSALAAYAAERRGPTLVCVESAAQAAQLRRAVPALGDFANVEVPFNSDDAAYPQLGWQSWCCRRFLERLARLPAFLDDRAAMARYANVPLAGLGAAPLTSAADAAFGRALKQHRHLSWASEGPAPDLGHGDDPGLAGPDDDHDLPIKFRDFARVGSQHARRSTLEQDTPTTSKHGVVEHPGCYRSASVRLDVFGSAVNAVMVSDELAASGELGGDIVADDDCAHAFRILRAVVAGWIDDVAKRRSDHADALLVRLDRWLSTRSSVLYYPALRRLVAATTRRVQRQLVAELRRLGVKVVHASERELVVATRENDAKAAAAHLDFVTQTIAARPVFRYLHLKPRAFYASLLYLDRHNFGAIELLEEDEVMGEAPVEEEDDDAAAAAADAAPREPVQDRFVSEWRLAVDLPPTAADWFAVLVGAFLHKPLKARTGDAAQDEAFAKHFVDDFATGKLLTVVSELQRQFPKRGDRHPALDFVVLACRALALDQRVEDEACRARRLLLASLGVREFAPAAAIKARPLAVEATGVGCPACGATLDVDVAAAARAGKAAVLHGLADPPDDADEAPGPACPCERCGAALPADDIEARVLETVNKCSERWATQDFRCVKCKRVLKTQYSTHCQCAGLYVTDIDPTHFREYLEAAKDAADYFKFSMLSETCESFLENFDAEGPKSAFDHL